MAGEAKATIEGLSAQLTELAEVVKAVNAKVTALETSDATVIGLKKGIAALAEQVEKVSRQAAPAVEERERERTNLVAKLAGHFRVPFSEVELESKPLEELRKIEAMAEGQNYKGKGGPQGVENTEQQFAATQPYWMVEKKDEK